MTLRPAANQPPVLLNALESRGVCGCDSFNSLEYRAEPAVWAVATVLPFLNMALEPANFGPRCDSFNSQNPTRKNRSLGCDFCI